jgi:hypothetical protein
MIPANPEPAITQSGFGFHFLKTIMPITKIIAAIKSKFCIFASYSLLKMPSSLCLLTLYRLISDNGNNIILQK